MQFESLVMTELELKKKVGDMLAYRTHWVFVPGVAGFEVVHEIERRFYTGGNVEDFKAIVLPFNKTGVYGFAYALKRRLSAPTLAGFLRSQLKGPQYDAHPITAVDLMKDEPIAIADVEEASFLMRNFWEWVVPPAMRHRIEKQVKDQMRGHSKGDPRGN